MGRPKKIVDEVLDNTPEVTKDVPVVEETVTKETKSGKSVQVFDVVGTFIREYSAETHGKDFSDLAKQFVADRPGFTIK